MLFFLFFFEIRQSFRCFFDFCVHIHKIVQLFSRSVAKSFSCSVVQSFSRSTTYIYIVEMGYFAAHSTWRHRVLYCTRYCVVQGTIWRRVGNFSLMFFYCLNSAQI